LTLSWVKVTKQGNLVKVVQAPMPCAPFKYSQEEANAREWIWTGVTCTIAGSILEKSQQEVGRNFCDVQIMTWKY
jgi:hypothetical protein